MRLALDTNRYTDLARGVVEVQEQLEHADAVFVPFVVIGELRCGFVAGKRGQTNEQALAVFLSQPNVMALYADEETTRHYARVYLQLRKQGTPIPTNDMWIAALCIEHGLTLYARDEHFDHLPQIQRM